MASFISIRIGIMTAIIEIIFGVIAGSLIHIHTTAWITFLASLGSIVLTFLAGTEVNTVFLRKKWKNSLIIGIISF